MAAVGIILAIIFTALVVALVVHMFLQILSHIEHRVAVRERLKGFGPVDPSNDAVGDFPNLPSGFEVFHNRKDAR